MGEQTGKGKQILLIIMSLVFLAITYFVFSKYVFNKDVPSLSINLVNSENTEAEVAKIKGKTKNIEPINGELFNSEKFRGLREVHAEKLELDIYKKGKSNPFEMKEVELTEVSTDDLEEGEDSVSDDN